MDLASIVGQWPDDEPAHDVARQILESTMVGRQILVTCSAPDQVRPCGTWRVQRPGILSRVDPIQRRNPDLHPRLVLTEALLRAPGSELLLGFTNHEAPLDMLGEVTGVAERRRTVSRLARARAERVKARAGRPLTVAQKWWKLIVWLVTLAGRALTWVVLAPGITFREGVRVLLGRPLGWRSNIGGSWNDALANERTPAVIPDPRQFRWFALAPAALMLVLSFLLLALLHFISAGSGEPMLLLRDRDLATLASAKSPSADDGVFVVAMNVRLLSFALWIAFSLVASLLPSTAHIERLLDDAKLLGKGWVRVALQPVRLVRWVTRPIDWLLDKAVGSVFIASGTFLFGAVLLLAVTVTNLALGL